MNIYQIDDLEKSFEELEFMNGDIPRAIKKYYTREFKEGENGIVEQGEPILIKEEFYEWDVNKMDFTLADEINH